MLGRYDKKNRGMGWKYWRREKIPEDKIYTPVFGSYRHIVLVADASNTKIKTFVLPRVGKTLTNEPLVNSKTLAIAITQKYMEKNDGQ